MQKRKLVLLFFFMCCSACMTPAQKFTQVAESYGFTASNIATNRFVHRVYSNAQSRQTEHSRRLHVYLDGDGTPWLRKRWKAEDPTSRNTLILELQRLDPAPAILLGRPCYHGLNDSVGCSDIYWTTARYSPHVVASMVEALRVWLQQYRYTRVALIGFSGGGTLAVLMAPYLQSVDTVVTLAANLDTAAWIEHHGYQPLQASLNPSLLEPIPGGIKQFHIVGSEDKTVPPQVRNVYMEKQPNAVYLTYEGFNHQCCWIKEWPLILDYIQGNRLN